MHMTKAEETFKIDQVFYFEQEWARSYDAEFRLVCFDANEAYMTYEYQTRLVIRNITNFTSNSNYVWTWSVQLLQAPEKRYEMSTW